jgi:hypothetical protein
MSLFSKLLCLLGMHGPNFFGNDSGNRSLMIQPFVRECTVCGKRWYGAQVETKYWRTLGDWKTKKQLQKSGEWIGD